MPWWYYDKKELRNTPSIKDGMDYELECQYRKEGARFIIETGNKMDLGYNTMATGVVYFHRFYMVHSFSSFPKYLTACCALFLAGKVEETPKKAKDIIKMAEKCLPAAEFGKFGVDPKEELLILERILLQSIKFDLQVDHPYAFLLKYAKSLKGVTSERQKMQDVLQMAWTFVNDSLCTTLCLQWEPEVIAVAMLYLAAKLSKYDINNWVGKTASQTRWWEMFVNGVTLDLLEDICHQVLDLYSQKRPSNSNSSLPIISMSLPVIGNSGQQSHTPVSTVPSNTQSMLMPKNTLSSSKPVLQPRLPLSPPRQIPTSLGNTAFMTNMSPSYPNINGYSGFNPPSYPNTSAPPPQLPPFNVPPQTQNGKPPDATQNAYYDPNKSQCAYVPPLPYYGN